MNDPGQNDDANTAPDNQHIAGVLEEIADLLEGQGANPFRVKAYREGATTVRSWECPIATILDQQGPDGLQQLPAIGRSLAGSIEHLVRHGDLPMLVRLRGDHVPEQLLSSVADIGPKLAERIHHQLGIETLTELAAAERDGRLAKVPGMGEKRLRAVRESLAGRFPTSAAQPPSTEAAQHEPDRSVPVDELLEIDEQYRRLARQGRLPRIAPRRFNPTREAWLPILHTERDGRHYTALFSNTQRAHEAGTTHDWVVIYRDDDDRGGRWTVITSQYGALRGQRVVRGREDECQPATRPPALSEEAAPPERSEQKHQQPLPFGD
ncbi:MAG: DNA polymerase III [Planctomycetaceae bacterium]|nr:MAG: DNA polymerase III [Planctomycetaceae bacterium]